jgi:sugar phosphate isomerase/epimerase
MQFICGQFFKGEPGLFDPEIRCEEVETAVQTVQSFGLRYASFNVNGDFMVRKGLEQEVQRCCSEITKAALFKPEVIILFTGWVDRADEAVYTQVIDSLKTVAKHAAQYGLTVALENHGGLTTLPEQCNRILQGVDEPNIGLNYDPANFEFYGVDPLEALHKLSVPVVFTHLKSVRRNADGRKEYCRLRDGTIDYAPILVELQRRHYSGFRALEYEETEDVFEGTRDDLESLRELSGDE